MTCDSASYLDASKKIQAIAKDEATCRAAVSRAYYACYHRCRSYYAALPVLGVIVGKGVHEQLINCLGNPSPKLTTNARARSVALGKYLRQVCDARVHADYAPDEVMTSEKMNQALATSEMIFHQAAVKKGPVE